MTTAIETTKNFQEKMFEKIRDQMGDLLTDEDLKRLVNTAVQKAFFEPRTQKSPGGWHDVTLPPLFIETITDELKPRMEEAAKEWIKNHPDEVSKAINDVIGKGFTKIILGYMDQISFGHMNQLAEQIKSGLLR